jgi:glycosyltransferase involved in cell wall biosynthesis
MNEYAHTPLITVVIPTYNRMPYIIEAIDSVIAQTYSNWELFVVDDGSTDGTATTINAINDPRVHLIQLKHEGVIGALRNTGAQKGNGEWICFLDSDDAWTAVKLELQLKALQQWQLECCYGNFELMNESGKTIPVRSGKFVPFSGNIIREVLTTEAAISTGALMLSRELFNKMGGFNTDPQLMYRDDYELVLRLALHAEIIALPDTLLRIREYEGRGTKSVPVAEAHERSAIPYKIFIRNRPRKELEKIARKQYARHMTIAAKTNFRLGKYRLAFQQIKNGLLGP